MGPTSKGRRFRKGEEGEMEGKAGEGKRRVREGKGREEGGRKIGRGSVSRIYSGG